MIAEDAAVRAPIPSFTPVPRILHRNLTSFFALTNRRWPMVALPAHREPDDEHREQQRYQRFEQGTGSSRCFPDAAADRRGLRRLHHAAADPHKALPPTVGTARDAVPDLFLAQAGWADDTLVDAWVRVRRR
jgi:hypothetical protein